MADKLNDKEKKINVGGIWYTQEELQLIILDYNNMKKEAFSFVCPECGYEYEA